VLIQVVLVEDRRQHPRLSTVTTTTHGLDGTTGGLVAVLVLLLEGGSDSELSRSTHGSSSALTVKVKDGVVPAIVHARRKYLPLTATFLNRRAAVVSAAQSSAGYAGPQLTPSLLQSTATVMEGVVPETEDTNSSRPTAEDPAQSRTVVPELPEAVRAAEGNNTTAPPTVY
jgi:hypothetical protein